MIPFDVSGTVRIATAVRSNSATVKAVANRLAAMLDEKDCSAVYVEGNRVRFTNAWFGGTIRWNWDTRHSFLSGIGSGTFDIEAAIDGIIVRYSLSLVRTWIGLAAFAAFFYLTGGPEDWRALWPFPLAPIAGFLVLYQVYVWGRVWYWLRTGLAGVSELSMKV